MIGSVKRTTVAGPLALVLPPLAGCGQKPREPASATPASGEV